MEKCHLIEVILSCVWHMFLPSTGEDKTDDDDDDDENLLKIHPLACMYEIREKLLKAELVTKLRKMTETVFEGKTIETLVLKFSEVLGKQEFRHIDFCNRLSAALVYFKDNLYTN